MTPLAPTLPGIFLRFLRFGLLAWGGPVAQIGMIKRELVDEERWISSSRFGRLLAVYQILPGPEAHELCVHLGMTQKGRLGGFLAGLGFMLPGLLLILLIAFAYETIDLEQPLIAAALLGMQTGVIALIVRAVHRISEHALSDRWLWIAAALAFAASLAGASFWIVLPTAGIAYALAAGGQRSAAVLVTGLVAAAAMLIGETGSSSPSAPASPTVLALFLSGLKAGLLTFGGAYTAIPFVRDDTVGRGWVSEGQFLDSLALSGIIPAPLIIFATFVGYLAGGLAGALAMTAGIFIPAFSFCLLFYDRLEWLVDEPRLHRLLEGVTAGVVGLIAATTIELAANVAAKMPSQLAALAIAGPALAMLYLWKAKLAIPAVVAGSALAGIALFSL